MLIELEPFSPSKLAAVSQGRALHSLYEHEPWLASDRPNVAHRYRNLPAAARNVSRLAAETARGGVRHSFMVRVQEAGDRAGQLIGSASVTLDQSVRRTPHYDEDRAERAIHAHDLDYVIIAGTPIDVHALVGRQLALKARLLHRRRYGDIMGMTDRSPHGFRLMGAVHVFEDDVSGAYGPNQYSSVGLGLIAEDIRPGPMRMQPVGGPAVLNDPANTLHELSQGGRLMQLYATEASRVQIPDAER